MIKVEVDLSALMYLKAEDLKPAIFEDLKYMGNGSEIHSVEVLKVRLGSTLFDSDFMLYILYKWCCTDDGEDFTFYSVQPYILSGAYNLKPFNVSSDFDTLDKAIKNFDKLSKLEVLLNAG